MNENLNLLEILKDCHKGTKFYSRFLGSVEFCNITSDNYIEVMDKNECHIEFKPNGTYKHSEENAEIDLFPSKDQRDWSKWHIPFVDGDVVYVKSKFDWIIIKKDGEYITKSYVECDPQNKTISIDSDYVCEDKYIKEIRFATEEEKKKLFDVIREKGYRWNTESKTLEKLITPKFKDEDKNHLWTIQDAKEGDVLAINWYEGYDYWEKIVIFKKYHNEGATSPCVEGYGNTFKNRKLAFHEEVPRFSKTWTSCLEPATKEQRDLLFQTIKEAGYKWNADEKKLEKLIEPKFKDGDIVATNDGKYIAIIKNNGGKYYVCCHPNVNYFNIDRLATLEEKEKLFAYIKENGYKWNAKTKTLEKLIVPKFKVGNKIKHKDTILTIITVQTNSYIIEEEPDNFGILMFSQQDNWELVPNKFDITTLKPFDKVLVRDNDTSIWVNAFFGFYDIVITKKYPFVASGINWTQCIPYEGNEHLLGTYEDCDEYYKNW